MRARTAPLGFLLDAAILIQEAAFCAHIDAQTAIPDVGHYRLLPRTPFLAILTSRRRFARSGIARRKRVYGDVPLGRPEDALICKEQSVGNDVQRGAL